jgi:hypothetical protein
VLTIPGHKENTNQNHTKIQPHLLEWLSSKTPPTGVGKDVGKRNPYMLLVEKQASTTIWKTIWRLLKKLNIDLLYDPAILFLGIYPKECDSSYYKGTCTLIVNSLLQHSLQ